MQCVGRGLDGGRESGWGKVARKGRVARELIMSLTWQITRQGRLRKEM
jgi:hypothetical protein